MKNFIVLTSLLITATAQAAPKSSTRECAVPMNQIKVESLTFGESKAALLQRLPSLQKADTPTNNYFFSPDMAGLHFSKRVAFVTWISYDKRGQIDGWRFAIGDQAKGEIDLNTSPEKLKAELIQRYGLPKTGWQKHLTDEDVTEYIYTCRDYSINIHQDYGAVRMGSGATFTVTRKPF